MSQQEVTFSQYMFNHQSLNPAYTGSKEYTQFVILHRTQWINFPGAPESQAFTFNHKMSSKYFGIGLSGVNDKIGPISGSRVAIDLAYHLQINSSYLSVGIKTGFNNFNFDENVIQTTTPNDLSFTFDDEGEFLPNIGFGFYYHSPRWYTRDFLCLGLLRTKVLTFKGITSAYWEDYLGSQTVLKQSPVCW